MLKLNLKKNMAINASLIALITSSAIINNVNAQDVSDSNKAEETVIVTATGRAKAVQDIPVAITAVTGLTLQQAGITDVRNLQQVVPSYRVQTGQSNGTSAQITVRGIGTGSDNPGYEGAVAVFIDGVYRNRSGNALTDLPKTDRIEVLRGPQGTLFGRNTSAGAVSIITSKPEFERNIYTKMEFGNFDYANASFGYTNAISDNTAIRIDASKTIRDGLITEINTGQDINDRNRWSVRAQTLTNFNDDVSLRLILDTAKTDEVCCSAVRVLSGNFAPAIQLLASLRGLKGIPPINEGAAQVANTPGRDLVEDTKDSGASAELNWKTGIGNFTSITAYREWSLLRGQDVDFSGHDRAYRDNYTLGFDTFTQEFRLNGTKGKLDWLVGAFYLNEKTKFNDSVKYGVDAARFADAVASGLDLNGAAPGGTGFTVYRSLPGQTSTPLLFAAALTPSVVAQLTPAVGATTAGVIGPNIVNAYANAILASSPVAGEGQQREYSEVDTQSISIFTHNVYDLTEKTSFTLGLRYNFDKKEVNSDFNSNVATCNVFQNTNVIQAGLPITFNSLTKAAEGTALGAFLSLLCNPILNTIGNGKHFAKNDESALNGTLSLTHNLSDKAMIYATYARGYKSGGFNYDRSAFNISPSTSVKPSTKDWAVKPEFTDNYEAGWKLEGLPGRTTLNGALFYEVISDYQQNAWTGFNFRSFNVDKMVSKGLELDLISRPVTGLTINAGLLLNDATLESDISLRSATNPNGEILPKGSRIPNAPEVNLTGSVSYKRPITGTSLEWTTYLNGIYTSETRVQTLSRNPITDQDAYTIINGKVGIGSQDGKWAFELWGRNLGDTLYHQYALGIPEQTYTGATGISEGEFANYKTEPKMYGVTLRVNF